MTDSSVASVPVEKLADHVGQTVQLRGWLYNRRSSGKLHFLQVRDGTGIVQAVAFKGDLEPELFESLGHVPQESAMRIVGEVREDKRSPLGVEVGVHQAEVLSESEPFPITKKEHSTGFLMERRHLWIRSRKQHATLRIRARVMKAIRDFLDDRGFLAVDSPIFTPNACEGTTSLFEVDYFDDKAYLTQSGQLYAEASAMAFGNVYCFGPTFRAEKSKTRRHLTEFWMVEPEMAFADLNEVMGVIEDMVCYIVQCCLKDRALELQVLERDVEKLQAIQKPFVRMSYNECVEFFQQKGHPFEWGGDFGSPDETFLAEQHDRPILVHRYPADVKAFYAKRDPEDDKLSLSVDCLAPEGYGEIVGGGERATDLQFLLDQIEHHKLPQEAFEWYLDLRRYGTVTHSGFGLGVERVTAWICGSQHLRECIPYPRMLYRIYP